MKTRLGPVEVTFRPGGMRRAMHVLREHQRLRKRVAHMPKPIPWDWARPRLVPLLAGPMFDTPDFRPVRAVAPPGCTLVFGIDLGGVAPIVDLPVAERWECSAEQLRDTAMANLAVRAARIPPAAVVEGTMSGRLIRMLHQPPGWAASLVLAPAQLVRLFGDSDQILGVPTPELLVSVPADTPSRIAAAIVIELEADHPYPLMLDRFVLVDGELTWSGADYGIDDLDDEA